MITISVASYNGQAVTPPLTAQFDETGGSIGRAESNQLVLPDPERSISRVHAQVVFRAGAYAVVDRGSNPVQVNGRAVGNGQEAPIKPGDELQIGGYLLRVAAGAAHGGKAAASDPFADFGGLAAPAASRAATAAPTPAGGGFSDPLAGFAPTSAGLPEDWNPFAPGTAASAPAPMPSDPFARAAAPSSGRADFGLEIAGRGAPPLVPDLGGSGSGGAGADSIDLLFGLGKGSAGGAADPFAASALGAAAALPNMAAHADPMPSLRSVPRASATAAPDHLSELNAPFNLAPLSAPAAPPVPPAPPPSPAAAPKGAVMSWDEPSGESRTLIRARAAAPVAAPAPMSAPAPAPSPAAAAPLASPTVTPTPSTQGPADSAALVAALRRGLAVEGLPATPLTPELLELVGRLLHEATRGTVELLVARAALKREVRAEVTMIVARENNPLKFSPSVDVAMAHLLGPTTRGFMPPALAMRDAYDDLRAHQFGFLAGMRAALEGVLQRFEPAALEAKLTQKSVLDSLLPSTRKARMWDLFTELYGQISAEASDDFHALFGKAFLKAYQQHIDELARDEPARDQKS